MTLYNNYRASYQITNGVAKDFGYSVRAQWSLIPELRTKGLA